MEAACGLLTSEIRPASVRCMFHSENREPYAKSRLIYDDERDIQLRLDTDDVNPDDVDEPSVARIVGALNAEFYPPGGD